MTAEQEQLLLEAVKSDAHYQKLLCLCESLEDSYARIKAILSPSMQDVLERYIALGEELEYRRTCLAVEIFRKK